MTSQEIRKRFVAFFTERDHLAYPSAPLVPAEDSSVLFTTAGMHQFKRYYTEPAAAPASKIVTVQPCVRTSDIEEVGDERHLTSFEMLGNFAFSGAYFKQEAIQYGFDFIIKDLQISLERIFVTVFRGDKQVELDQESIAIWRAIGIPDKNIRMGDRVDNWWGPTGETGPCGPTTEIYVDGIEIWNIVFNEYLKTSDGTFQKLTQPGIDTGAGLERLAMVLQGKETVFDTDLYLPLVAVLQGRLPTTTHKETRVILDHVKTATFLLAEGVLPTNKDRGYILRRLIRRAMRYARKLGSVEVSDWGLLIREVIRLYSSTYPLLARRESEIQTAFEQERIRFAQLLEQGIRHLAREMDQFDRSKRLTVADAGKIAEIAFHVYQSFGFPPEMVLEEFEQSGFPVREFEAAFEEHFKKHQAVSRAGLERKFGGHGLLLDTGELRAANQEELKKVTRLHTATHLLQAALREVLGSHVLQKGSDITAERLRFDFNHDHKLTPEEITKVEDRVNEIVHNDVTMQFRELPLEAAKATGALWLPHAHYKDTVKVYYSGPQVETAFTKEFCGGPHVSQTSEVGQVKILKDEALAAGVRRIRADVT